MILGNNSFDIIHKKIVKRFNDLMGGKQKIIPIGKYTKTDRDLGKVVVQDFHYGRNVWTIKGNEVIIQDSEHTQTRNQYKISGSSSFQGNFSIISPLGSPIRIGIAHGSHRSWDKLVHLGSVTLVEIPDECIIIFHAFLFHYGDRAQWCDYQFKTNLSSFAYLREKNYNPTQQLETYHSLSDNWCKYNCLQCASVNTVLKIDRCQRKKEMVWMTKHNKAEIMALKPGDHVFGDIGFLGWAVIKSFVHRDVDKSAFLEEMHKLNSDFVNNHTSWHNIDSNENMQFEQLI